MKIKSLPAFLIGVFLLSTACSSRKVDNDTYMSGPEGAAREATVTDQAETTSARTDSTQVIILNDSLKTDTIR